MIRAAMAAWSRVAGMAEQRMWGGLRSVRGGLRILAVAALAWAPSPMAAQGWIEPPPGIDGSAVERLRSEVSVRIRGSVAEVEVAEWFLNRGARVAEGHYLYPLPGEAVFRGFSLFQGDAELRGEIMDADRARAIYEEIVRRRADPALIEFAGEGLLRARVFPIEPGDERKVTLRYTQLLARAGDALQLVYAAGTRASGAREDAAPVRFRVEIEDGETFLDPFSPTHPLSVVRRAGRVEVSVEGTPSGRLSLFLPLARERAGLSLATHRPPGEDGYFMLTLSPGRETGPPEPRDVTVVLDVSGSMSGEKIEQARAALHGLLGTLRPQDRFRLVAFSNAVRRHRADWSRARGEALADARRWVDGLVADGGTNMEGALREAFAMRPARDRLPVVVFLTDGLPSVGEQDPSRLAARAEADAGRARVFAFGIGHDVNTHLLDRLGDAGRGSTQYVEPGENVERAVGLLAAKLSHPILTELELAGAPVRLTDVYPVRLPDLFAGEELVILGRYRGEGEGTVRVRGERQGRRAWLRVRGDFPAAAEANPYIPRLWASRKLGHLTRQTWTEGETPGLVEEIRALALRYGLPSRYTSYLVQEPVLMVRRDASTVRGAAPMLAAAPPAAQAVGAGAVRVAEEARAMREASSLAKLADVEAELQARVESADPDGGTRIAAGRVFRLREGVWTDEAHREGTDVVEVRRFSRAYFDVLAALDEVRLVAAELESVLVAGAEVSLRIGETGVEALSTSELAETVGRFRGSL